jgi:putative phage-type endonuclease
MAITHNVEQGTFEWLAVRLGIPTASDFDKIITSTGKASTQTTAYAHKLLAEILTGKPVETFEKTEWMERGVLLESSAVQFYEVKNDVETVKVGFVTDDKRTMGCSPDRLVGDDGLLEIKCPAPHTHVGYMLAGKVDRKYWPQLQGQLLVSGRKWVDWMSYHPEMQPVIVRVERDEEFIKAMHASIQQFNAELAVELGKLMPIKEAA